MDNMDQKSVLKAGFKDLRCTTKIKRRKYVLKAKNSPQHNKFQNAKISNN